MHSGRRHKAEKEKNPLDFRRICVHNVQNRPILNFPPKENGICE